MTDSPTSEHAVEEAEIVELEVASTTGTELTLSSDVVGPPGPSEWRAMREQAAAIARTEFVPPAMRGKPDDVLAAILTARELQIGPMAGLQGIRIQDGKPAYDAELMRALVRRRGHLISVVEKTHSRCKLRGKRADTGETAEVVWDLEDALLAGLVDRIENDRPIARSKNGYALPWEKYPKRMLYARATSELVSELFSDVLVGGSYTPEELADPSSWDEPTPSTPADLERERRNGAFVKIRTAIESEQISRERAASIAADLGVPVLAEATGEQAEAVADAIEHAISTGEVPPEPDGPGSGSSSEATGSTEAVQGDASAPEPAPDASEAAKLAYGLKRAADGLEDGREEAVVLRSIAELIETMGLTEPEVRHVLGHAGRKSVVKALAAAEVEELDAADNLLVTEYERRSAIAAAGEDPPLEPAPGSEGSS